MKPGATHSQWDARIDRAHRLAALHPHASELLGFYGQLATRQQSLAHAWSSEADPGSAGSLAEGIDRTAVLDRIPSMLRWLETSAPAATASIALKLRESGTEQWADLLERLLAHETAVGDAPRMFVVEAIVQPLAELLATSGSRAAVPAVAGSNDQQSRCPFCGGLPLVGVLREEGHGARRALLCGLCLTEWPYARVVCPSCGERRFEALPVYTAEQVAAARVEGCDSCRMYLKTIDASKDGLAVPLVDDLATVTLDLWAREQGYTRLRPNVLRI